MEHASSLSAWEAFYVIVGSSGGALIGLQFVVITLMAERGPRISAGSVSAFGTPTVVHFGAALLISAIMSAPWPSLALPSLAVGLCGFLGLGYGVVVVGRALRQKDYQPVGEDWIWFVVLPCVGYLALTVASLFLRDYPEVALFGVGGAALTFLIIGIHNSWDSVTHIIVSEQEGRR